MSNYSKNIVYLSQQQYQELITNQQITVDGVTIEYNENDIYVTPQSEPVTDVRVNGTSISSNGIANIPVADQNTFGVAKIWQPYGIRLYNGTLRINPAQEQYIKGGSEPDLPIVPSVQHTSTFYGLSKVAGADLANEQNITVGTYPAASKAAIQQMLGVSSLIAPSEPTLVASKAYAVGDVFTANGKLYKVTTAIAAAETIVVQNEGEEVSGHNAEETSLSDGFVKKTDYADSGKPGIVQLYNAYGITKSGGYPTTLQIYPADDAGLKAGTHGYRPVVPSKQHTSVFYGLSKVAGVDLANETVTLGTYPATSKAAIKSMIGVNVDDVQVNGTSVVSNGIANIDLSNYAARIAYLEAEIESLRQALLNMLTPANAITTENDTVLTDESGNTLESDVSSGG